MMVLLSSFVVVCDNKLVSVVSASTSSSYSTSGDYIYFDGRLRRGRNHQQLQLQLQRPCSLHRSLRCCSHSQHQILDLLLLPSASSIPAATSAASYGALLLAGGLFAYARSGSKGSLIGGLAGSSLMAAAFVLMQSPDTKPIGDSLAFGSALLFTFVFGIRLAATRKVIPAGLLLGLSIVALAVFVSAYLQDSL